MASQACFGISQQPDFFLTQQPDYQPLAQTKEVVFLKLAYYL